MTTHSTLPVAIATTMQAYLAALAAPDAGGACYDLLTPEASLLVGGHPHPRHTIDRTIFARSHRETIDSWQAQEPERPRGPLAEGLTLTSWNQETRGTDRERGVAWFQAADADRARTLHLAVGFERTHTDGDWLIDWCALANSPGDWGYELGKAQMLAELAFLPLTEAPRAWLDVSYHRLYGLATPPLLVLPEARFSCQGSGLCCRIDYELTLPAAAQTFLDAMPWETLRPELAGHQLPVLPDGSVRLKAADEGCRYMDENRHCVIHKAIGRAVFAPCAIFPYAFAETPDGIAVTTSSLCGSARANMGAPIESQAPDLYYRLALFEPRPPATYRLGPGVELAWEDFHAAEKALARVMERTDLPLYRRLWLGNRLLEAWLTAGAIGGDHDDPRWETEPILAQEDEDRHIFTPFLGRLLIWGRDFVADMDLTDLPAVHHDDLIDGALLERQFRNLAFGRSFAFPFSLVAAQNVMCLLYTLTLTLQALDGGKAPERVWQTIARLASHGTGLRNLLAGTHPDDEPLSRLLGHPFYGRWVLGYADAT